MAMYIIENFPEAEVQTELKKLISKLPINLKRLFDHGRGGSKEELIKSILPELTSFQEDIILNTNVGNNKHL